MSGHSKWSTIKHRKASADAKKGKITTKLIKEVTIAVKLGGKDPQSNPRLRLALEKCRENNISKDNVERAIQRGAGEIEGINYEEIRFEGYGVAGVGVIVECLTDNKTRTVADVRHVFTKYGGNLGTDGCVAFQFKHCGSIVISNGDAQLADIVIDAGAEDIITYNDGHLEIITIPQDYLDIKSKLAALGYNMVASEIIMRPEHGVDLAEEDAIKMQKLIDAFDELDDVQEVYTTAILK